MYARSNTITARPERIDDGIRMVTDEVMPLVMGLDGSRGMSMLVDRQSGRCIVTTAWDDMDRMRGSDRMVMAARQRVGEAMGAEAMVEEWEIACLHREHPATSGSAALVVWAQLDQGSMDHGIDTYRMRVLPTLDEMDGFCSASLFVDRMTGRSCATATFESRDALMRNRDSLASMRDRNMPEAGVTATDVCEFELVLAHLHVPETV
ncbi:MAG: hypothetical protein ACLGIA_12115 [Actinomycetes bacterium]